MYWTVTSHERNCFVLLPVSYLDCACQLFSVFASYIACKITMHWPVSLLVRHYSNLYVSAVLEGELYASTKCASHLTCVVLLAMGRQSIVIHVLACQLSCASHRVWCVRCVSDVSDMCQKMCPALCQMCPLWCQLSPVRCVSHGVSPRCQTYPPVPPPLVGGPGWWPPPIS